MGHNQTQPRLRQTRSRPRKAPLSAACLGAMVAAGAMMTGFSASAFADPTGQEHIDVVVASVPSGDIANVVIARGVYHGIGRDVSLDSQPGDPSNLKRDDLVFPDGTMHILNMDQSSSFKLDPRSCTYTFHLQQTPTMAGGTGRFVHAAGAAQSQVSGLGLASRNPDGSCNTDAAPLLETFKAQISGTLTL